jgi:hypothetical protein
MIVGDEEESQQLMLVREGRRRSGKYLSSALEL